MRSLRDTDGKGGMKIHHLYTDDNGESHFEDIEIEYVETTPSGRYSERFPATGIIFREVQPSYDLDWHNAPRRQYIINQSRQRGADHGQRWRSPGHQCRRSDLG